MVVQTITASEHAQRALALLAAADADIATGEYDSVSSKLWNAVEHAIAAVAKERGWKCNGDGYLDMRPIVERLEEETSDDRLLRKFDSASMFFYNYHYTFLADYEIEFFSPSVHRFIPLMLAHLD